MSATPGKVQLLDIMNVNGEKVFALRLLQGRNAEWTNRLFFAAYDPAAVWWDDLKPAPFDDGFFFDTELHEMQMSAVTGATRSPVTLTTAPKAPNSV